VDTLEIGPPESTFGVSCRCVISSASSRNSSAWGKALYPCPTRRWCSHCRGTG